jgi:uncharacterized protein with HEPN domain
MRNRIARGYFDIDFDVVWDTADTFLPVLLAELAVIRAGRNLEDTEPKSTGPV